MVLKLRLILCFRSDLKRLFLPWHLSVLSLRWLRLSRLDLFLRWRLLFPDCQLRLKLLSLRLFPAVLYFLSLLFRLWHLSVRQLP